jgi:hypothetical protein
MKSDIQSLTDIFRQACKPPDAFEEAEIYTGLALKELGDASKPQAERYKSAIRLLCCIKPIGDRLPDAATNEIYGRRGVMLASEI